MCRYPQCRKLIYDYGSKFKLHFEHLCDSYGIKRKPTTVKNPQANAILERVHQVLVQMLRTSEIDMADSVSPDDIDVFLDNAAWAICSTYHTVLKASPGGAAVFGRDMLFDIPFVADWKKIGDHRQSLTDCYNERENKRRIDYDYKVGDRVLIAKDSILRKSESKYCKEPWTITCGRLCCHRLVLASRHPATSCGVVRGRLCCHCIVLAGRHPATRSGVVGGELVHRGLIWRQACSLFV